MTRTTEAARVFTGIVQEVGRIARVESLESGQVRLSVTASEVLPGTEHGDSIAVSGVCLTVSEILPTGFAADVMTETLERTTLGRLKPGVEVNLERAATPRTALGGHIVQGHIDGTGEVVSRDPAGEFDELRIAVPPNLARYIAEKGSIAVEGVSLTVADVADKRASHSFRVALIPTTLRETTLGRLEVGDHVNVEVDVIAKYVERLMTVGSS